MRDTQVYTAKVVFSSILERDCDTMLDPLVNRGKICPMAVVDLGMLWCACCRLPAGTKGFPCVVGRMQTAPVHHTGRKAPIPIIIWELHDRVQYHHGGAYFKWINLFRVRSTNAGKAATGCFPIAAFLILPCDIFMRSCIDYDVNMPLKVLYFPHRHPLVPVR